MNTSIVDLPHLKTDRYLRGGDSTGSILMNWHDDAHEGAFGVCLEQPCHALKTAGRA